MKQGKAANFFWFVGIATTLNYFKKMFDFYIESLDEPRKKKPVLFLYDYQNTNRDQKPKITDNPSNKSTVKFRPGKSAGGAETE